MNAIASRVLLLAAALTAFGGAQAQSTATPQPSRASLLYSTHCVACHNAQVHWRDKKLAKDWPGLIAEVRRWQANAGQRWADEDVIAVAQYLNRLHYHYQEVILHK